MLCVRFCRARNPIKSNTANFKTDNGREERIEMKLEDMFDFDEIYKKLENKLEDDMYTHNETFDFDDFDMVGIGLI